MMFGLNILIGIVWSATLGGFGLLGFAIGFGVGFAAIVLGQLVLGTTRYIRRAVAWIKLIVMFHYELVVSSIDVAIDVLTPQHLSRPAIIEVPLDVKTDLGILLVANLISLTPGTLSLDVSPDRKTLRVHAMFVDDPDALRESLKSGFERWVIDAVEAV